MDTPNEFWVGPVSAGNHWVVGPLGELDELADRTNPGTRKFSVGIDLDPLGGMSQNQADTVRALLCELVEDGDLDVTPANGIQYPSGGDFDSAHMIYMRCFTDECDTPLVGATAGMSTGYPWKDGSPPQASPEPLPPEPVEEVVEDLVEDLVEEPVVEEEADGDADGDEDADG